MERVCSGGAKSKRCVQDEKKQGFVLGEFTEEACGGGKDVERLGEDRINVSHRVFWGSNPLQGRCEIAKGGV